MTKRNIIRIDEDKCDGCGLCATACVEGAIRVENGKARLISEVYCDGLGACLGECPQGALTIEVREAVPFDAEAVDRLKAGQPAACELPLYAATSHSACPGSAVQILGGRATIAQPAPIPSSAEPASRLVNWPVQLALVPVQAPYYQDADLLIAADCVSVAVPDFQARFLAGQVVIIGCPKLDDTSAYRRKLAAIFAANDIRSIQIAHMEVPCCFGLVRLVQAALADSGKQIPVTLTEISIRGDIQPG